MSFFESPSSSEYRTEQIKHIDESIFHSFDHHFHHDPGWTSRFLTKSNETAYEPYKPYTPHLVDYSVLSVVVMTLGLILVVEFLRHRIDHAAHGRPFFKTVLDGVNTELATLGIVEFFLYLFTTYSSDYDKDKYKVFAQVHFLLFYTAILNAVQTCILAFVTYRASRKMWIEPEELDTNHYVDIREEFRMVSSQLKAIEEERKNPGNSPWTLPLGKDDNLYNMRVTVQNEGDLERNWFQKLYEKIHYSPLKSKYNELLLQIRFHESKILFLHSFPNIPMKLRISEYLLRCELHVLIKFVHVSSVAWIFLTIIANLVYYVLGMVTYKSKDPKLVGAILVWIFFSFLCIFILVAYSTHRKMKSILRSIMTTKEFWISHGNSDEEKKRLFKGQVSLFWGSCPANVISVIQFMQFGFALALSGLVMYWAEIKSSGVPMYVFVMGVFMCYFAFLSMIGQVIPMYTMCTNLAQMVDKTLLNETIVEFYLDEAKRRRRIPVNRFVSLHELQQNKESPQRQSILRNQGSRFTKNMADPPENVDNNVPVCVGETKPIPTRADSSLKAKLALVESCRYPKGQQNLNQSEQRNEPRHGLRSKAVSEGVAFMSKMGNLSTEKTKSHGNSYNADDNRYTFSNRTETLSKVPEPVHLQSMTKLDMNDTSKKGPHRQLQKSFSDVGALHNMKNHLMFNDDLASRQQCSDDWNIGSVDYAKLMTELVRKDTADLRSVLKEKLNEGQDVSAPISTKETLHQTYENDNSATTVPGLKRITFYDAPNDPFNEERSTNNDEYSLSTDIDNNNAHFQTMTTAVQTSKPSGEDESLQSKMRSYFESRKYVAMSNLFGTTVVFFMVAKRVEMFLHAEDIVSSQFISFHFDGVLTFWVIVLWFIAFMLESMLIFWSMPGLNYHSKLNHKKIVVAAALDLLLIMICLFTFLVAESYRCCEGAGSCWHDNLTHVDEERQNLGAICCCSAFGSRLYGGLGNLEPFSALVALRLFRHYVAKRLLEWMEGDISFWVEHDDEMKNKKLFNNPFAVFDEHGEHHHDTVKEKEPVGTAVELWNATCLQHPELVEKFGEISIEILQAMLGMAPLESDTIKTTREIISPKEKTRPDTANERSLSLSIYNTDDNTFPSDYDHMHSNFDAMTHTTVGHVYQDDQYQSSLENQASYPDALLLRSMRRCDRKVLPLLDKWSVVDVVLTRFELVYFDASDVDDCILPSTQNARELLRSTKGGRSLRLCDVTVGRRIVGHLELSDIQSVHVHRNKSRRSSRNTDDATDVNQVRKTEFWQPQKLHFQSTPTSNLSESISDVLTIKAAHGRTVVLRFYSDDHSNKSSCDDKSGESPNTNALYWAQSIVRLCGRSQLYRQNLPQDIGCDLTDYLLLHQPVQGQGNLYNRMNLTRPDRNERQSNRYVRSPFVGDMLTNIQYTLLGYGNTDSVPKPDFTENKSEQKRDYLPRVNLVDGKRNCKLPNEPNNSGSRDRMSTKPKLEPGGSYLPISLTPRTKPFSNSSQTIDDECVDYNTSLPNDYESFSIDSDDDEENPKLT